MPGALYGNVTSVIQTVLVSPYTTLAESAPLTVNTVATTPALSTIIAVNPAYVSFRAVVRNRSAGGQNIRVGIAPVIGPPAMGWFLAPTDILYLPDFYFTLLAVADADGGILERLVFGQ